MQPSIAGWVKFTCGVSVCLCGAACNIDWAYRNQSLPEGHTPRDYAARVEGMSPQSRGLDLTIVEAREVDLVEGVLQHRGEYLRRLRELKEYYDAHGRATKAAWAGIELDGAGKVRRFRYLLDAEVPDASLTPRDSITEADDLYEKGRTLMRRGGHGVPALYRRDLMVEAAQVLRGLIERFPSSDKIDDAAFLLGEIHKEYFPGLEPIAVRWYERAIAWNPNTPHPVRFQAAVVYDFRLHDRDRALELYHAVLEHETDTQSNVRFATRRIKRLTGTDQSASAPATP